MKKLLSVLFLMTLVFPFSACTAENTEKTPGRELKSPVAVTPDNRPAGSPAPKAGVRVLVAYFSATGTTKPIAEYIAEAADADLFEIVPAEPYSADDLNYNDNGCRANREQQNNDARPAISGSIENMGDYDVIFIGHPIWWGEEPRIIDTFVETYDLSGKTVIDFCTSGGSGISQSESNLKALCPGDVTWLTGKRFAANADYEEIQEWTESLSLTE
ncbi:flavodoxin [Gehongia tenuis]|uniref:Flavodoxin n=1 Tax=Gehongia tenuis TaxID=2763655 RepID=A0A926D3R1_9FIRM|nr:flavodoxin [Gehongia tenuis]MBC8530947.1 flavodoxin [Gehongia tenuis]